MARTAEELVVRSTVRVPLGITEAWDLFTERMATWWPLESHSVYGDQAAGVVLEPRVGGRILETSAEGATAEWGAVTEWDPPRRIAFTWHPGQDDRIVTQVEVGFREDGDGTTVTLVHTGWEALGARGTKLAESYRPGWELVLGRFVSAAGGA